MDIFKKDPTFLFTIYNQTGILLKESTVYFLSFEIIMKACAYCWNMGIFVGRNQVMLHFQSFRGEF